MNLKVLLKELKSRKCWPDGQSFYHSILRYPNYFDLLPGETKVLTLQSTGPTTKAKLTRDPIVRTLPDAFTAANTSAKKP